MSSSFAGATRRRGATVSLGPRSRDPRRIRLLVASGALFIREFHFVFRRTVCLCGHVYRGIFRDCDSVGKTQFSFVSLGFLCGCERLCLFSRRGRDVRALFEARGGGAALGGRSLARDPLRVPFRAHASSARWRWASARRSWKSPSSLRRRGPRIKARGSLSAGTRPCGRRCGARPRPREEVISRRVIPTSARETRARDSRASSLVPSDASPSTLGKSVVRYATGIAFRVA